MKNILFITISLALTSFFSPKNIGQHQLKLEEAERILGEPAVLKERKSDNSADYYCSSSTFSAKEVDVQTQKQGNLFYKIERFKNIEEATKTIQTYIKSNKNHQDFELLTAFGDEAFYQTDKENYCILVARKSNKLIRLKVNKITSNTSFDALLAIGKGLLDRM